jgi:cytochrome c556
MSRRIAVVVILIAALLAATTIFAQQRAYNLIMKDVQTTFASLKKNLDASGVAAAPAAPAGRGAAPAPAEEANAGRGGAAPKWDDSVRDAAVQDATKLQALFKETEAFWAKFDTHDAMNAAHSAQDGADQVIAAAKANDPRKAQAAYAAIQKNCGTCHFSHREETGKGFLIRP